MVLEERQDVRAEVERKAEVEREVEEVPLTITPPPDEHQPDVESGERELSQRPEHRYDMGLLGCWHGIPLPSLGCG